MCLEYEDIMNEEGSQILEAAHACIVERPVDNQGCSSGESVVRTTNDNCMGILIRRGDGYIVPQICRH